MNEHRVPRDTTYDALLVLSFGGPEGPADVLPFLENVTRGRGVPAERLADVAEHYHHFGGVSPINAQNRALTAAIRDELRAHSIDLPVYWGNRNWSPYLVDTVRQMRDDGIGRVAAFVTSAYASYSGCRQYRENLYDAVAAVEGAPRIDRLRHCFNHPGFIAACTAGAVSAVTELGDVPTDRIRLVFVTHSIPVAMAAGSGPDGNAYVDQHRAVSALVAAGVAAATGSRLGWDLVYCSRSGSPRVPWLEPDVNDHLAALAAGGVEAVVVVPVGFVSDHMEVVHDLDTEAAQTAARLGLRFGRAPTAGTHPSFVSAIVDLLLERAAAERGEPVTRVAVGDLPAGWDRCASRCCPNPRAMRPSVGEAAEDAAMVVGSPQ